MYACGEVRVAEEIARTSRALPFPGLSPTTTFLAPASLLRGQAACKAILEAVYTISATLRQDVRLIRRRLSSFLSQHETLGKRQAHAAIFELTFHRRRPPPAGERS